MAIESYKLWLNQKTERGSYSFNQNIGRHNVIGILKVINYYGTLVVCVFIFQNSPKFLFYRSPRLLIGGLASSEKHCSLRRIVH